MAAHRKGVFVSLVVPGSPAAMAGLRFGDQLLTLGSAELAGRTEDRVHAMLRSVIYYLHVMVTKMMVITKNEG